MKIAITGASGLIGKKLTYHLKNSAEIIPFKRRLEEDGLYWNYQSKTIALEQLNSLDAIIHLAGAGIADQRWTKARKKELVESRVLGTRFLVESINKLKEKPKSVVFASAIGIYPNLGNQKITEDTEAGTDFLATLTKAWEAEMQNLDPSILKSILRIGIALDPQGGALKKMLLPFSLGLGGPLGTGKQFLSWISMPDLCRMISFIINNNLSGVFNACSPHPVSNLDFSQVLAKTLKRPCFFRTAKVFLDLVYGKEFSEGLLFSDKQVLPKNILATGFKFEFPDLESALENLLTKGD